MTDAQRSDKDRGEASRSDAEVLDDRDLLIVADRLDGGVALSFYSDWRRPVAKALRELHALRGASRSEPQPSSARPPSEALDLSARAADLMVDHYFAETIDSQHPPHTHGYIREAVQGVFKKLRSSLTESAPPIQAAPAATYMNKLWSQCRATESDGTFKGAEWECHTCGASSDSPECRYPAQRAEVTPNKEQK